MGENGPKLKQTHDHYYQVQTQIFVCNADYGDYVVWCENNIVFERLTPDADLWSTILEKCEYFFIRAVMPELVGHYFSKPPLAPLALANVDVDATQAPSHNAELYCICKTPYNNSMSYIGCENESCKTQWFHFKCMKIKRAPKGDWYCPECKKS